MQVEVETVRRTGLDAADILENRRLVDGIDVIVNAEYPVERRIGLLPEVPIPLGHPAAHPFQQVEAAETHFAQLAHQCKRALELRQPRMGAVDLGVVDVYQHEVGDIPLDVVKHIDRGVNLQESGLRRIVIAAEPVEGIVDPERLFLSGTNRVADLLRHERILEEIEPDGLLLGHAEDLHVLVVEIDQPAVRIVKLHADLDIVEDVAQKTLVAVEHLVGLVHLGLVREEGHDLPGTRRVENVMQVTPLCPFQIDMSFGIFPRPEHLRSILQHRREVASEFGDGVSDVGFARKVQNFVRGVVRVDHPVIAQPARLVTEHLHPDIAHRHVAVEILQIEPVGLRRLLGTLQLEAQSDDVDQRREPLAVLVGPFPGPVDNIDARIPPHLVAGGEGHDNQGLDMLHGQQIALVRRFGRQFGKIGQNDGKPFRNPLRPPGKFRHRNLAEPVLFAGNAVGRHLVRAVVGPVFPVEFDDVGPSAMEHRQHFIQDLIDRVLGPLGVQQREQRMRNAGKAIEQVFDPGAVAFGGGRLFEFRLLHITGHDIPSVGSRFAVDHFPLKP